MRERGLAEFVLALFAGRERAAVIYGDLTEMAAARGRAWFAAAYLRTLAVLSWRGVVAVVVGMSVRQLLVNTLFHPGMQPAPGPHVPIALIFWFEPSFLWFVFPFVAVLYGMRDRLVHLAALAALGVTIAFLFLPRITFAGAVATLTLGASALLFSRWRKEGAVLAATLAFAFWSAMAAGSLSMFLRSHEYVPAYGHGILGLEPMLAFRGSMLAAVYLCVRLHRWVLQNPKSSSPFPLAGGTHA